MTGNHGNENGGNDGTRVGLSGLQFALAIVLILALVLVAWYLIDHDLIDKTNGPAFYSDVVQGIVILGGAFFGIPISWRAGKSSGKTEGKAEGEKGKEEELKTQKQQIGADARGLVQQAMSGHESVQDAIEENFSTLVGTRSFRLARDTLGDRTVEIDMGQLSQTREALARLDQFVADLERAS